MPNPEISGVPSVPTPSQPVPTQNSNPSSQPSSPKKSPFNWQNKTSEEKRKFLLITGGSTAILLALIAGVAIATRRPAPQQEVLVTATPAPTPSPTPTQPVEQASNLDGVIVPYALSIRHPMAVMIENSVDARPQAGLNQASIVYEAIAEGGITRFMAIFGHSYPSKVGPVRSARPYYVRWSQEYSKSHSAYYVHVGGSPEALNMIKSDGIYDMDQFGIGTKAFQRIPQAGRATEHTMFGYPDKLLQVAKDRGWPTETDASFRSWKFKADTDITNRPETQTISIPFSGPAYAVKYTYDKASNTYRRYLANAEHKDDTGKQITPKNVAVVFLDYSTTDSKGRQDVKMTGTGPAKVFLDGKVIEAKWKKANASDRTLFIDSATGEEISFNRGQIWIEAPKTGTAVTVQ